MNIELEVKANSSRRSVKYRASIICNQTFDRTDTAYITISDDTALNTEIAPSGKKYFMFLKRHNERDRVHLFNSVIRGKWHQ